MESCLDRSAKWSNFQFHGRHHCNNDNFSSSAQEIVGMPVRGYTKSSGNSLAFFRLPSRKEKKKSSNVRAFFSSFRTQLSCLGRFKDCSMQNLMVC